MGREIKDLPIMTDAPDSGIDKKWLMAAAQKTEGKSLKVMRNRQRLYPMAGTLVDIRYDRDTERIVGTLIDIPETVWSAIQTGVLVVEIEASISLVKIIAVSLSEMNTPSVFRLPLTPHPEDRP